MNSFFKRLIKRKALIPLLFLLLTIISIFLLPFVNVNYDMSGYLPDESGTKQAITILKEEFDYPGTAEVMADDVTMAEAYDIKRKILSVPGVKNVLWLDDLADVLQPEQFLPLEMLQAYYKDGAALFRVEFHEDNYSEKVSGSIETIKSIDSRIMVAGNAENANNMKSVLSGEIVSIVAIVLPICLIILLFASHSWLEPFLYLVVIGISIAINMGTNSFFGSISFITNSMASVLQLAICMDYSIFLMHRYFEERDNGADTETAVKNASAKSVSSVSASALTTIAGFLALVMMRYRIGADVGFVLAKGILISFLTVIILMPVLMNMFGKALDKTRHRFLLPSSGRVSRLAFRLRYLIIVLAVLIIVPAYLAQDKNDFFYGDNSVTVGEGRAFESRKAITEKFGISNIIMILVPDRGVASEIELVKDLNDMKYADNVVSAVTSADPAIPVSFLPDSFLDNFRSARYSRLLLYLNEDGENKAVFEAVDLTREILQSHYPDEWYAAGVSTSIADIRDTVTKDSTLVSALSLIAVGFVVLVVFRSLSIPLLLLFVIQSAVWINMSIPYYSGFKMAFIGYLVISSLQLGATIDYGILLTNRYMECRNTSSPSEAAFSALRSSGPSVIVSALILATAGFGFGMVSGISSISELGMLIGRGALLSCLLTLLLLPALLSVFDKVIFRTTLKRRGSK